MGKTYVEEEEEELLRGDGDVIEVDHKLQAQEYDATQECDGSAKFDPESKFMQRFAFCTFVVGCLYYHQEILVRNAGCLIQKSLSLSQKWLSLS